MKGIARVWRGYTKPDDAEKFERFLEKEVFPGFESKLDGYRGGQLLKRTLHDEVEFTTIMWFDSIDSIRRFAGADYQTAHIDPNVQGLLTRYDMKSLHSEVCYSSI